MHKVLKKNSGFSLLELIVVLAILAVMGSLSVLGLLRFRQTAILKQASREFFSNIETARNKARNNTLSTSKDSSSNVFNSKVDAYAIVLEGSNYSLYYCDKTSSIGAGTQDYTCDVETADLKAQTFVDVAIAVDEESAYECSGILFETVSGDMRLFNDIESVATVNNECTISVNFSNTNLKELIKFDAVNNQVSYINN